MPSADIDFGYSDADFRRVRQIAMAEAGISLPETKKNLVYSRLSRRIRETGYPSFNSYLDFVVTKAGEKERDKLICAITTNVTSFFREGHHFEHLHDVVLPQIARNLKAGGMGRLWSAACSTGQEAWSMAMTTMDVIPDAPSLDMKILGTDINRDVVDVGRRGVYLSQDLNAIPSTMKKKWVVEDKDEPGYSMITGEIRELTVFNILNLNSNWPIKKKFDAIFCRNVVIYFSAETREALWKRLADHLVPGGYLYVGHSERVERQDECNLTAESSTIYRKRG